MLIAPSLFLAAAGAGYTAIRGQKMERLQKAGHQDKTAFALAIFSLIFNMTPEDLRRMPDHEIEAKLHLLKQRGCGLDEMIYQQNLGTYAEYVQRVEKKKEKNEEGD